MKKCIKCNLTKSIIHFYKHPKMSDGYVNKCKDCCKEDIRTREQELSNNPEWVENEKKRQRDKYYRLNYKERHKPSPEKKKIIIERFKKNYPEKIKAKNLSQHLKPKIIGNQLHHWSYKVENAIDVIELTKDQHNKIHRFLKYDKRTFMYKDLNNNLLDSKEKHEKYINKIFEHF